MFEFSFMMPSNEGASGFNTEYPQPLANRLNNFPLFPLTTITVTQVCKARDHQNTLYQLSLLDD